MFRNNKRKVRSNTADINSKISTKYPRHMNKKDSSFIPAQKSSPGKHYLVPPVSGGAYMAIQKKEPHIITGGDSAIGARSDQQDSYFVTKSVAVSPFKLRRTFAIVCDGMGGLEAGDRASLTAVEMMKLAFGRLPTKKVDIPHFYHEMLENIDYEINHWNDLKTDKGSGTTLVSVIVENRRLYWASVGDSTIFMVQDGKIKRITREHNYKMCLTELVSDGVITQQQADTDPQRNALISYLGMGGIAYMDITTKPYVLKNGDLLMLCSDGVTNALTDDEILNIIKENTDDIYTCCKAMTKAVTDKNKESQDNATVVIVQYVE